MIRKGNLLTMVGVLAASFAGGACYQWAFRPQAAQAQDDAIAELRARSLVIVDQAGNARASLATTEDGAVSLVLNDAAGTPRLIVSQADQTGVQLFDQAGDWRGGFSQGPDGTGVHLSGANGAAMAGMNAAADGLSSGMYLLNSAGTKAFGLGSSPGGAGIGLMDLNGTARVNVGVGDDGNAAFSVLDADGVTRAQMNVTADGAGSLAVRDGAGQDIWRVE